MTLDVNALGSQLDTVPAGHQAQQGAAAAASGVSDQTAKSARPDWLPESYFDSAVGSIKLDDFGKHYSEMAAAHKVAADRLAAYPQKVEDLRIEPVLGEGEKLPDGVTFDDKNPLFVGFRQFVFDNKLDQKAAGQMLGMYAKAQMADVEAINERVKQEDRKLGANGPARIAAVRTALEGKIGKDLAGAVMSGVFRADQVQALEKIVLALANGGTADISGGMRDDAPAPQSITERWYPQQKAN